MSEIDHNVSFYRKMAELQEKLRKSEEERLKLEERFSVMIRSCREEEEVRLLALRDRYEKFLRDDRRRRDRNERILQTLDRIENRSVVLAAKTDRLRLLRRHYETYVAHVYPSWKPQGNDSTPVRSHVIQRPILPTPMAVSNITNIASPRTSVPLYPITDVKTIETITSTRLEGANSRQILPTSQFLSINSQVSGLLENCARPDINIKDPEGKPLIHTHAIGSSVLKYIAIGNRQGVLPEKPPFLGPDIHDNSPTSYIDQAADSLKLNRDAQPSTFVKGLHSNLGSTNDISKLNVDSKLGNSVDFEMEQNTSKDLLNISLSDDGILQEETAMANPSLPPSKDHKAEDPNLKVHFDTSGGRSESARRLKDIEVNESTRYSSDIINSQHKLSNVHKEGISVLKPTQFVPELNIDCGGGGDSRRDVKGIPGLPLNQGNVASHHLNSNANLSQRRDPSMPFNEDYSGINVGSSHHEGDRHTAANKECLDSKKDTKNNDPKMLAVMQEKSVLKEPSINNFHNAENIKRTSNLGNTLVQNTELDKDWQVSSVQKEIVGKPSQYQQEVDLKLSNLNKNELYENARDQKQRQRTEENHVKQSDVEIINIHSSGGQQVLLEQTHLDHKKGIPVQPKQYEGINEPEIIHRLKGQYLTDEQSQDFNTQRQYQQSDDQGQYLLDKKGQYITLDDKKASQKFNERTQSQHIEPNLEVQPSGSEMGDVSQHEIDGKGLCLPNKTGQHQKLNDQGHYQQLGEQGHDQQLGEQEQYQHLDEQGQYQQLDEQGQYQQLDEQGQYQQLDEQGQYQQLDEQGQYQQLDEQGQYQQLDEQGQYHQLDEQGQYQQLDEQEQYQQLDEQGLYQQLDKQGLYQQLDEQGQHQQLDRQGQHQQLDEPEQYTQLGKQGQYQQLDEQGQYQQLGEQGQYQQLDEQEQYQQLDEQGQYQELDGQGQYQQLDGQGQYQQLDEQGQYQQLDEQGQYQQLDEQGQYQQLDEQGQYQQLDEQGQYQQLDEQGQYQHLDEQGQYQQLDEQGQYQQLDEQGQYQQLDEQGQYQQLDEQGQYQQLDEQGQYQQLDEQGQYQQLDEQGQYQQLDEQGQYQQLDEQGQYQQLDNQNQRPIGEQIHYQVDGQDEYVLDEKGQCLPLDHQGQYQHTFDSSTNQPVDQDQNKFDNASVLQQQEVFEGEETEYHQPQDNAEDIDQTSVTQGPVEQLVDLIGIQSSEIPKETLQQYRSLLGVTAEPSSEMTGYSDGDEVEDQLAALVTQHQISSVDTQMSPDTTNLKDIHQTKNIDAIQGKMSALSSGGLSLQMMDVLGGLGQDLASDDSSEIQGPPSNITQESGGIKPIIQSNLTQEESVLPRLPDSGNTICRDTQLLEQPNLVTTVETKPNEDIKAGHKLDSGKPKTFKPVSKKLPDLTKMLESDSDSLQLDVNATLSNVDSDDFDFSSETQ